MGKASSFLPGWCRLLRILSMNVVILVHNVSSLLFQAQLVGLPKMVAAFLCLFSHPRKVSLTVESR